MKTTGPRRVGFFQHSSGIGIAFDRDANAVAADPWAEIPDRGQRAGERLCLDSHQQLERDIAGVGQRVVVSEADFILSRLP
jgi:hypothetical protein